MILSSTRSHSSADFPFLWCFLQVHEEPYLNAGNTEFEILTVSALGGEKKANANDALTRLFGSFIREPLFQTSLESTSRERLEFVSKTAGIWRIVEP